MNLLPDKNTVRGQLILLAPPYCVIPRQFTLVDSNPFHYEQVLASLQELRGKLYFQDGALEASELCPAGRHRLPVDQYAWHLVALDKDGEVRGCARYMAHRNTVSFSQLGVAAAAEAQSPEWGAKLRASVEGEIQLARKMNVDYVEVGGWAISPELRCTTEALRIVLASYALARILGGCVGIGTVTQRNFSSSILRRIGGRPLSSDGTDLPAYFDPKYQCQMEILRFDSAGFNPRFEVWVNVLHDYLKTALVISGQTAIRSLQFVLNGQIPGTPDSWNVPEELVSPARGRFVSPAARLTSTRSLTEPSHARETPMVI